MCQVPPFSWSEPLAIETGVLNPLESVHRCAESLEHSSYLPITSFVNLEDDSGAISLDKVRILSLCRSVVELDACPKSFDVAR